MLRSGIVLGVCAWLVQTASGQLLVERVTGAPFAQFGGAVAVVGDIDGDGVEDFAVGEPVFSPPSASGAGRVTVFSGSDAAVLHVFVGEPGDGLGTSLAAVGDLDGDSVADILAGAPAHTSDEFFEAGRVVAFSGATGGVLWSIEGSNDFESLGGSVSGAGDYTGDGRPEVLVGTSFDQMFVLEHDGRTLWQIGGGVLFGYRVQGIGDVSGDGTDDFLVAESWYDVSPAQPNRGRVHVLSGATGLQRYEVVGDANDDYLGRTLARLDDVDGDAVPDFIAASYVSSQGGNQAGLVRVVSGADGATVHQLVGAGPSKWFGFAVTGCTDLDLDGVPDLAIGIPGVPTTGSNGLGQVQFVSGAGGGVMHDLFGQDYGAPSNAVLGFATATGDFNLDGLPDFVVGDPLFRDPALGGPVGAAEVYLGCPSASANYGAGWPGTNGVPALAVSQAPALGSTFALQVGNSLGATTPALLFVGLAPASMSLPSGATLLVTPLLTAPLTLPPAGILLPGSLPDDPALCFANLYLQVIELDAGAVGNRSFTPGLELTLGFDL